MWSTVTVNADHYERISAALSPTQRRDLPSRGSQDMPPALSSARGASPTARLGSLSTSTGLISAPGPLVHIGAIVFQHCATLLNLCRLQP